MSCRTADNQMFMPTVFEDMLFGPLNYGMPRPEAEALVDRTLAELNLTHLKNRRNHKLSGGEKRMAAIATILAMQPKIMLMDEPSTALDPKNRRTLIRTLRRAAGDGRSSQRTIWTSCSRRVTAFCCCTTGRSRQTARRGDPARPGAARAALAGTAVLPCRCAGAGEKIVKSALEAVNAVCYNSAYSDGERGRCLR